MLSLPAIFNTTIETVPARVPYLMTDPVLVEHWRRELANAIECDSERPAQESAGNHRDKPFVIGIAWQGNPSRRMDDWRSFPLKQLAAARRDAGSAPGQSSGGTRPESARRSLIAGFPSWTCSAAASATSSKRLRLMTQLDLVITPDSAVAHLAGGLGKKVWVGLCSVGDWRYPHGRSETPWYPTMRLFRQSRLGDWDGVFQQMKIALGEVLTRELG